MRTLIFGCGYLGRRVASSLINQSCEVYAVTRSPANAEQLRNSGIHPIVADACDANSLTKMPDVDVVLHAIGYDRNSARSQEEVTRGGTENILNALKHRYQRLIHISSTSVYGQANGEWVDEISECVPTQPGGQLALEAEALVKEAHLHDVGSRAFILRLAGIYGPDRLLSRIEALKGGQPIAGREDAWLNLIHVDDAVRAVVNCAFSNLAGGTFVIVDNHPLRRREYFETLARLVDAPPPTFDPTRLTRRGSGGLNKRCSNKQACEKLDWTPGYPSAEVGLRASIASSPKI